MEKEKRSDSVSLTSSFTGNLGNHMWIYAITRIVAHQCGYEWGFNPQTEYDYYKGKPQMGFMDINYGKTHTYGYTENPPWIKNEWHEQYEHHSEGYDYHPFQPDIFNMENNTKLFIRCCQDPRYLVGWERALRDWFTIKEENQKEYQSLFDRRDIVLDENMCIINIRGGEYKGISNLILRQKYWEDAIALMRGKNAKMRFLCVSDDIQYANQILDFKIPTIELSMGADYYTILNAKNLIISNSSFALFPTYLNENDPYVIAPRYWARHNVSNGYWANSDIFRFGWNFLDRDGHLYVE